MLGLVSYPRSSCVQPSRWARCSYFLSPDWLEDENVRVNFEEEEKERAGLCCCDAVVMVEEGDAVMGIVGV